MAAYVLGEASARFLRGLMRDRRPPAAAAVSRRDGQPMAVQGDDFAAPYEVRWATSAEGWIIWLPAEALVLDGAPVDVSEGLDAAGGAYPDGWYKLGISASASSVYLIATRGDESTPPSARFEAEAPAGGGELDEVAVLIASMSGREVRQTVASALVLSTAGVTSLNALAGDLAIKADDRQFVTIDDQDYYAAVRVDETNGVIYIGLSSAPPEEGEEDDTYCNRVSRDGENAGETAPGNAISGDGQEKGLNGSSMADGNVISRDPCNYKKES